jgi:hypothetical protein
LVFDIIPKIIKVSQDDITREESRSKDVSTLSMQKDPKKRIKVI